MKGINDAVKQYVQDDDSLPAYAWPGGYPVYYITKDNSILCPDCANNERPADIDESDNQWFIIAADVNYDDSRLYCDHCGKRVESAYADEDE